MHKPLDHPIDEQGQMSLLEKVWYLFIVWLLVTLCFFAFAAFLMLLFRVSVSVDIHIN
jgi:hypothetical protein